MAARRRVAEQHEDWLNLADAEGSVVLTAGAQAGVFPMASTHTT